MASQSVMSAFGRQTPGLGTVNQSAPFSFKSSSAVGRDYGSKPSVSALMNPTLHNNVPEPMVNSTARVPIFARPFSRGFEKHYSEGDVLFVQRGDERASMTKHHGSQNVVANIPVLNYLLRTTKIGGTNEATKDKLKYDTVDKVLSAFNYFGIMNNDMDTGSKWQRLLNVNVRGRSRVARMWKPMEGRLKRGDQLWLAFVETTTKKIQTFEGPNGVREVLPSGTTYIEVLPTLDCCKEFKDALYLIPVGIVSQVTMKSPIRGVLKAACHVTEKCKLLERIEVLMRI
jgi:hypothetical protein